ncbi:MarR family transcriptional regulator [Pseudonocardia sp. WMMC193]|uniref:MarR family winged helix-turn-helix transcriptional regulator n=1 Tax=Pseudonocardia sp. WMMC193 TaxID=2911965 RepID=UPI001F00F200|nr:MarR family transcriptional regulator [Pseudonocardia sp. WMMC193]MCF7550584.1 MarR family transcriptional regulator [Pseudonocardia sp. WMMC193]
MDVQDEIMGLLVRFIASVVLHNHAVSQQVGLGPTDSQFMTLLDVHGPLSPGRLAELTGLTSGTVTGVVDRLEKAGFVRRDRDPGDRRKVIVTPDRRAAEQRLSPQYAAYDRATRDLLDRRSPQEQRVIADFLADLLGGSATRAR